MPTTNPQPEVKEIVDSQPFLVENTGVDWTARTPIA